MFTYSWSKLTIFAWEIGHFFVVNHGNEEVLEELFLLIFEDDLDDCKILAIDAMKEAIEQFDEKLKALIIDEFENSDLIA